MNTNPTLQDRAVEAAARFLEVRGYETLATGWKSPETRGTIDLVARDPESDDLVFVDVSARPNSGAGFGDGRNDRETMELLAVSWLVENDFAESVGVRFDKISMIVVGEDRALLRHHINVCLVKSHLRKRARPSFGFQHASFSVSGAGTPLAS